MKKDLQLKRKQRLKDIKSGRVEPRTKMEKGIAWAAQQRRIANQRMALHAQAAINKPNEMNGRIVVIAPKS
jgi:hypothetical protein